MTLDSTYATAPQVFISYAGPDQTQAERLDADLRRRAIYTFFAPRDIDPVANSVALLSQALAQSDYYVLLVSTHSVNRPWVEVEWTTALAREVNERRAFLFLFRLDNTPPPMILSARSYLEGYLDWDSAVNRLVETWQRDWETRQRGIHILPAPGLAKATYAAVSTLSVQRVDSPPEAENLSRKKLARLRQILADYFSQDELRTLCFEIGVDYEDLPGDGKGSKARELVIYLERQERIPELIAICRTLRPNAFREDTPESSQASLAFPSIGQPKSFISLYVFNQAFSVQHVMRVAPTLTGQQLYAQVRAALALQDGVSALGGRVGLRFAYILSYNDTPLSLHTPLDQAGIVDGANLDLRITVQQFSPDGKLTPVEFRSAQKDFGTLPPTITRRLVSKAFAHLLP